MATDGRITITFDREELNEFLFRTKVRVTSALDQALAEHCGSYECPVPFEDEEESEES